MFRKRREDLKTPTKYYVESLVVLMENGDIRIKSNIVLNENRYGIRNDDDIILVKDRQFTKFYFMILDDLYLSIKPIEQRAESRAKFYYLALKHYSFVLTCDDEHNLHFIHTPHNKTVDENEDIVYLITYYNGYKEEPLRVSKFDSLKYEMSKLNKEYGLARAYPINFTSFNTAFDL